MASSGATAWQKYFRGKGDLETKMKKDSEAYDAVSKAKLNFKVPAGTDVMGPHSISGVNFVTVIVLI